MGKMLEDFLNIEHGVQAPLPPWRISAIFFSNWRTECHSFGNWGKSVITFNHSRCGAAAIPPERVAPAGTDFGTPDWGPILAPSPIRMWLTTPTCPAKVTSLPILVLPAMPA